MAEYVGGLSMPLVNLVRALRCPCILLSSHMYILVLVSLCSVVECTKADSWLYIYILKFPQYVDVGPSYGTNWSSYCVYTGSGTQYLLLWYYQFLFNCK